MFIPSKSLMAPLLSVALLIGCAPKGAFPSLGVRPVEQLSFDEPTRVVPVVAEDTELGRKIAELSGQAWRGQGNFEALLPAARSRASAAGAMGSESWIEAQQALSRLEAARALTVSALAELDRLVIERAARPTNAEQFQQLSSALERTTSLSQAQQAEVDRLRTSLTP